MEPGVFYRKIRSLNPQLKIWCGNDDSKPAGIFYVKQNEYTEICGIDKGDIPERIIYQEDGSIAKGGWRRALRILITKRLVNKEKAEKVFRCNFEGRKTPKPKRHTPGTKLEEVQERLLRGL